MTRRLDAAKAAPAKIRRHAFCSPVVASRRSNPRAHAFAKATARSLGLHFPLPSLSASGGPSDSPQRKNQIDAGATDRVLPPHSPNPIRGSKSKTATPGLVPILSFGEARYLGGTSRP